MKNSWMKRVIAVLLCLAVFAVSELSGVTNVVRDLYAEEMDDGSEASEDADSYDKTDNDGPTEAVEEVALESPSEEDAAQPADQPQDDPGAEATEGETTTGEEAGAEPGGTEASEGEAQDGEQKEDSAPAEAGTEGTETPAGTEEGSLEQKTGEEMLAVADGTESISAADKNLAGSAQKEDVKEERPKFDEEYTVEDQKVKIHVAAEEGVLPAGVKLSVKPVVQQDVEALEADDTVSEEEVAEAKELNAKFEDVQKELEATVAEDETKKIAGFLAYDISFLLTDKDGEVTEIEPDGGVSVTIEFEEAYLPEEVASDDAVQIESIDIVHMKETEEGLKPEVLGDAKVDQTETAEVEKTEFTVDSFSTFVITWTGTEQGKEFVCDAGDVIITVTAENETVIPADASLQVIPILASDENTKAQYEDVETRLQEKAEQEAYQIAGFLAYDISFVDKDGAKIEPDGAVKVSMEYKEAKAPEELETLSVQTFALEEKEASQSDDEESQEEEKEILKPTITVMHLEENEKGEVTQIVDMTEEGKVTALESTDANEVEKAEFVTERFSVFTVVWLNDNGNQLASAQLAFYDSEGNLIANPTKPNGANIPNTLEIKDGWFNVSDITEESVYYQIIDEAKTIYTFKKIDVVFDNPMIASLSGIQGFGFTESGEPCMRTADGSESGLPIGVSYTLRFIYSKGTSAAAFPTIETVDSNRLGVTMRMIDYVEKKEDDGKVSQALQDKLLGNKEWNKHKDVPTQNIVGKRLKEGYPVTVNEDSLRELFDSESEREDIKPKQVNNLFSQHIYETTGYLQYSCFENYAYLPEKSEDFLVYTKVGSPQWTDPEGKLYNPQPKWYQRGNFFPYTDIQEGVTGNKRLYDENGEMLNPVPTGEDNNEDLYLVDGNANVRFGMYMEAKFTQPKNGKIKEDPMVYKFNGDDDLWVFIDDTLVLDLGGSHNACTGTIDFSSGIVEIKSLNQRKTIQKLFEESGYLPNGKEWPKENDPQKDEIISSFFNTNGSFKDYTMHTFKMFYMERGGQAWTGNASNLYISMNLATIPDETIEVEKKLNDEEKEKYTDVEFAFQVLVQPEVEEGDHYSNNNPDKKEYTTLTGAEDRNGTPIQQKDVKIGDIEYQDVFYLKPGQVARFPNQPEDRKYYVKELGVKPNEYDSVSIIETKNYAPTDTVALTNNNIGSSSDPAASSEYESGVETVGTRPKIIFENKCSDSNDQKLFITKTVLGSNDTGVSAPSFNFRVTLGSELYTDSYKLYDEKGDPIKVGESETHTATEGEITGVKAGYKVEIDHILAGTTFEIEEVVAENYELRSMEDGGSLKNDSTQKSCDTIEGYSGAAFKRKIIYNENANIIVTNAPIGYTEPEMPESLWEFVKASSSDPHPTLGGAEFTLTTTVTGADGKPQKITYTGVSSSDDDSKGVITWKNNNNQNVMIADMGDGTYTLTESKAPAGYVKDEPGWKFTITKGILEMDEEHNGENYLVDSSDSKKILIRIFNDPLYELPSTGGIGTHWYTIGGTLLMMAGMLILYRNKKRYAGRC